MPVPPRFHFRECITVRICGSRCGKLPIDKADLVADPLVLQRSDVLHQDRKFIAADAADIILLPEVCEEGFGNLLQNPVPRLMTEAVVDAFEFIGVHQQEKGAAEVELLQQAVIAGAVDEPGQFVCLGLAGEAVLGEGGQLHGRIQPPDEQGEHGGTPDKLDDEHRRLLKRKQTGLMKGPRKEQHIERQVHKAEGQGPDIRQLQQAAQKLPEKDHARQPDQRELKARAPAEQNRTGGHMRKLREIEHQDLGADPAPAQQEKTDQVYKRAGCVHAEHRQHRVGGIVKRKKEMQSEHTLGREVKQPLCPFPISQAHVSPSFSMKRRMNA